MGYHHVLLKYSAKCATAVQASAHFFGHFDVQASCMLKIKYDKMSVSVYADCSGVKGKMAVLSSH